MPRSQPTLLLAPRAHLVLVFLASLVLLAPASAAAQSSRREQLANERAAKAEELKPYEPARLERALLWVEQSRLLPRLFNPYEGWYPHFGGLTKGAGLGMGPGYKQWFWQEQALWDTYLVASVRNYWTAGTGILLPRLADGRVEAGVRATARYWPRERYFGLGRDSARVSRVGYLREGYEVAGDVAVTPRRWLRIGGTTAFTAEKLGEGSLVGYPSIEEVFDDSTAPGLDVQPNYWWSGAFVDVDYRDVPGHVRSGGHFRADYQYWRDQESLGYTFHRIRGEALHAFPLFDKKRVFVLRAIGESTDSPSGNIVPFFHMPTVGGATTLRGYTDFRFRDRHMVLFNAEYRWEAFSGLDMALFADLGDVAPTWDAIDLGELKSSYGLGFRFNAAESVFLRLEVARGSEGTRLVTSFSGAF